MEEFFHTRQKQRSYQDAHRDVDHRLGRKRTDAQSRFATLSVSHTSTKEVRGG